MGSERFNLVLERALIHHINDIQACFNEAYRVLQENGIYIIQDRTPDDCLLVAEKEKNRRYNSQFVIKNLKVAGFKDIEEVKLWEVRKEYENKKQLLKDLSERTGRSILHELDDSELQLLINHIDGAISVEKSIIEKDR